MTRTRKHTASSGAVNRLDYMCAMDVRNGLTGKPDDAMSVRSGAQADEDRYFETEAAVERVAAASAQRGCINE